MMKPAKIDVEETLTKVREIRHGNEAEMRAMPDADQSFIDLQIRAAPMVEGMTKFLLDEMNMGVEASALLAATLHGIASGLGPLQHSAFIEDIFANPPAAINPRDYDRYKPEADHAMLHIILDLLDKVMHGMYYQKQAIMNGEELPGQVTGDVVTAVDLKMN